MVAVLGGRTRVAVLGGRTSLAIVAVLGGRTMGFRCGGGPHPRIAGRGSGYAGVMTSFLGQMMPR